MANTLQPGHMIPVGLLEPLVGGPPVRIGSHRRRAQVLVVIHPDPCDPCAAYLGSFESLAQSVRDEKADLLASWAPAGGTPPGPLTVPAAIVDGALLEALSPAGTPVVAVVDRFGQSSPASTPARTTRSWTTS